MKFAKEVKPSKKLMAQLEKAVADTYLEFIFDDVFKALEEKPLPLQNSVQGNEEYDEGITVIRDALYKGNIFYKNGNICCEEGKKFGLKLSKAIKQVLKGKYNKSKRSYKIDLRKINPTIRADIVVIRDNVKESVNKIQSVLETKQGQKLPKFDNQKIKKAFDKFAKDIDTKTSESLKLGINQFTKENLESIRDSYINDTERYIANFSQKRLPKIREKIAQLTLEKNFTHSELAKIIKKEFGFCENKCKFIARQESSLARAAFVQQKAQSNGMDSYVWETAHDEKVRDNPHGEDHKYLDGRTFKFSDPPIIDHATGRRANPGQDFNCRCVAKIIVSWD